MVIPALFQVTMSLPSIPRLIRLTATTVLVVLFVHLASVTLSNPLPRSPTSKGGSRAREEVRQSEDAIQKPIESVQQSPNSREQSVNYGEQSRNVREPPPNSRERCVLLDGQSPCTGRTWSRGTLLPNLYGHYTVQEASEQLENILRAVSPSSSPTSEIVVQFLCTLYLPPCPAPGEGQQGTLGAGSSLSLPLPLPCRPLCEMARGEVAGKGWPSSIQCHMFPTERCYSLAGPGEVKYVKQSLMASGTGARMHDVIPQYVATLDSELGDDDPYDVQVMTLGTNHIPPRRYDITDLGDPMYFQGWADVQGTGAANDYCRVIGKGKRRFLSCALAGTRGQGHQYVSKLGFDPGHSGTWFMRDVDNDGRDDYCRCVGEVSVSRVMCMKAGEKGFYGSTVQGGSENTFELPGSRGCHNKRLNPHFGV